MLRVPKTPAKHFFFLLVFSPTPREPKFPTAPLIGIELLHRWKQSLCKRIAEFSMKSNQAKIVTYRTCCWLGDKRMIHADVHHTDCQRHTYLYNLRYGTSNKTDLKPHDKILTLTVFVWGLQTAATRILVQCPRLYLHTDCCKERFVSTPVRGTSTWTS